MRRLFGFIVLALLALVIGVGAKTLLTPSKQIAVAPVKPVAVDGEAAAARLGAAVRFKTIAVQDQLQANAEQFAGLQAHLQASFPKLHALLKREVVGERSLLYTWAGSDAAAQPIALMAHQDVVPIAPGTENEWEQPPFSGALQGGFVWGRGAWDDKGNLMSIMEAVEMLAASGFRPRQTIYLVFGQDEEIGGERGAKQVAALLKQRGVQLQFVMDEGLLITEGILKGLARPAALVGVAEKGYMSLEVTATATPGHSSMPPPQPEQSAIGMLSAGLVRLEDKQMPAAIKGLSREMFETLAPEMQGINRVFLSNLWLFKPLVERELQKSASTNAVMRTTTALTVISGGNKDNVLPGHASATVNFRLLPGDSSEQVMAHVQEVLANPAMKLGKSGFVSEASPVSATTAPGYQLIAKTLRQLHADTIVAPGLMTGATDSRHFIGIADTIYRFSPVRAHPQDLARFHGTNERISIANYVELIQFYHQLLTNTAGSPPQ